MEKTGTKLVRNGEEYAYQELLDDEGYYYRIGIRYEGRNADVLVTRRGISVVFHDGDCVDTNLVPRGFPLDEEELISILDTLSAIQLEGVHYSRAAMEASFTRWQRECWTRRHGWRYC